MSKTELFIKELLNEDSLQIVEEKDFKELLLDGYETEYIKDLDIYHNVDNLPFPLFKVKVLRDDRVSTNYDGGYDDYLEFVFKYKNKYYHFYNIDSI